jgi:hypothetical protein
MIAIVKSTFVDIVDECCKHGSDSKRRSTEPRPQLRTLLSTTSKFDDEESNRPVYRCTGSIWVRIVPSPCGTGSDDEGDVCRQEAVLTDAATEGVSSPKCVDVYSISTIASEMSSSETASQQSGCHSAWLDAVYQIDGDDSNSDEESARVAHTLTELLEERHKRPMRNRHATLPFALASEALQDATNHTEGIQGGIPASTDIAAIVQFPVSVHSAYVPAVCLWPCHLPSPALVGFGATPEHRSMVGSGSSPSESLLCDGPSRPRPLTNAERKKVAKQVRELVARDASGKGRQARPTKRGERMSSDTACASRR